MDSGNNGNTNPQVFLNSVADAMDAAADRMEGAAGAENPVQSVAVLAKQSPAPRSKFAQKLVYSSCYTLSFGVCFPVFLVCKYVPKNNSLVQGLIEGGAAASRDVDAWLARNAAAKQQYAANKEDAIVTETGAEALAPA